MYIYVYLFKEWFQIQVMLEDQMNRGGIFVTNDKGLVPPLATTDFIVDDKGNSSKYIHRVLKVSGISHV